jgi:phosphoglycerol transferase MdoB-like AlkP superfamily enzyme
MQQTNIMPTVMSLLNYDKPFLALGYNAFDSTQTHAAFNFISGLYQITTDDYCLLFNGEKSTALFAKTDFGHKKNLLKTKPLKAKELENILKAYLQDYSTRMRNNKLKQEYPVAP